MRNRATRIWELDGNNLLRLGALGMSETLVGTSHADRKALETLELYARLVADSGILEEKDSDVYRRRSRDNAVAVEGGQMSYSDDTAAFFFGGGFTVKQLAEEAAERRRGPVGKSVSLRQSPTWIVVQYAKQGHYGSWTSPRWTLPAPTGISTAPAVSGPSTATSWATTWMRYLRHH